MIDLEGTSNGNIRRYYSESDINSSHSVEIPVPGKLKLLSVIVTYKTKDAVGGVTTYAAASVTKNATVTLDSEKSSAFDALLTTIALSSAGTGIWAPSDSDYIFMDGDKLTIATDAGGANIVATVMVTFKSL